MLKIKELLSPITKLIKISVLGIFRTCLALIVLIPIIKLVVKGIVIYWQLLP